MDRDEDFNDLIAWNFYQLHKPVHTKWVEIKTSGMYSRPIGDKANLRVQSPLGPPPMPIQPQPQYQRGFDPVKAAAKDAARDGQ